MNISNRTKLVKLKDHQAAGTSGVTSDSIDTAGFRGVRFFTSFGTAAAGNSIKAQQSDDDGDADDYSDIAGSSVVSGADPSNEDVWLDIYLPRKRYLQVVAARGTSSTLESIWAELYDPVSLPVDGTTDGTVTGELHVSPAEGTA